MCHILINVCKSEEKLLERLDQAILDVIDSPEKSNKPPLSERYFDKLSTPSPSSPNQGSGKDPILFWS
jgi:hypothetical protein